MAETKAKPKVDPQKFDGFQEYEGIWFFDGGC